MRTRDEIVENKNAVLELASEYTDATEIAASGSLGLIALSLEVLLDIRDILTTDKSRLQ